MQLLFPDCRRHRHSRTHLSWRGAIEGPLTAFNMAEGSAGGPARHGQPIILLQTLWSCEANIWREFDQANVFFPTIWRAQGQICFEHISEAFTAKSPIISNKVLYLLSAI